VTTSPYGLSGADSLPATAAALAAGSAPAPPSAAATLPATGTFSCDSERPRERLRALGPGGADGVGAACDSGWEWIVGEVGGRYRTRCLP